MDNIKDKRTYAIAKDVMRKFGHFLPSVIRRIGGEEQTSEVISVCCSYFRIATINQLMPSNSIFWLLLGL